MQIVGKARLAILEYFEVISAHNCKINFSVHVKRKGKYQFASSEFTPGVFLDHILFLLLSAARSGEHSFNFNINFYLVFAMHATNKADSKKKCAMLLAFGRAVGTLSSFRPGLLEVCARSQPVGCRASSCPTHPAATLLPNITNQAQLRCNTHINRLPMRSNLRVFCVDPDLCLADSPRFKPCHFSPLLFDFC